MVVWRLRKIPYDGRSYSEVLQPVAKTNITWEPKTFLPFHPNGMLFESYNESGEELDTWTVYSIGGGTLANESFNELRTEQVYDMHTIKEIQAWCEKTYHSYWEYVEQHEGPLLSGIIWLRYGK